MIDALFPNWANPEAIAAVVGLRFLFNIILFGYSTNTVGIRSVYTGVLGILVVFTTITTMLLLSTGWLGHSASYVEQVGQILILAVSAYVAIWVNPRPISGVFLLSWIGALVLLFVMVPIYGEAFVAP